MKKHGYAVGDAVTYKNKYGTHHGHIFDFCKTGKGKMVWVKLIMDYEKNEKRCVYFSSIQKGHDEIGDVGGSVDDDISMLLLVEDRNDKEDNNDGLIPIKSRFKFDCSIDITLLF